MLQYKVLYHTLCQNNVNTTTELFTYYTLLIIQFLMSRPDCPKLQMKDLQYTHRQKPTSPDLNLLRIRMECSEPSRVILPSVCFQCQSINRTITSVLPVPPIIACYQPAACESEHRPPKRMHKQIWLRVSLRTCAAPERGALVPYSTDSLLHERETDMPSLLGGS